MTRRTVLCTCKSHCTTYDPNTQTFVGPGHLIPKSTALAHHRDDLRIENLDDFSGNVASRILDLNLPSERPDTSSTIASQHELFVLETEVSDRTAWASSDRALVFAVKPSPELEYQHPSFPEVHLANHGPHALDPTERSNALYLENESRLCEILRCLGALASRGHEVAAVENKVYEGLRRMRRHRETEWNRQRRYSIVLQHGYVVVDSTPYLQTPFPLDPVISTAFLTTLIMCLFFRITRRAARVLIAGIRSILQASRAPQETIDRIPKDPRTLLDRFDLEPRTTSYIQCPACYALYPYSGTGVAEVDVLEGTRECTHQATPGSRPCGVPLWTERRVGGRTIIVPRRKYVHQSLKEWVARMLACPGVEESLDAVYSRPPSDRMGDVWDSPVVKSFRDTDGTPFFAKHGDEARLLFSLGADSFHPLGSLEAKQTMSATAIYMVLENFPPEERFKYRNMYLAGVIPGPGKPSLEQINHALSLLTRELLEFWKGVFLTSTARFGHGRFCKGAMIPLVCDMLAARQMAGFGSVTSTFFCTFCLLTIQDIENLNKSTWPERRLHDHLQWAREWRDCDSERERECSFKLHGLRWSALLHLPYWNPILFSVVDSMHAAFLGLFQTHCRKVWGIDVSVEGGDGSAFRVKKPVPRPSDHALHACLQMIRENPRNLLERLVAANVPKNLLWHVCVDNGLRRAGGKLALAKGIVEWRRQVQPDGIPLPNITDAMEVDSTTPLEPGSSSTSPPSDEMVTVAERAFSGFGEGHTFLRRFNREILRRMCQQRGLEDSGTKNEMWARLSSWRDVHLSRSENSQQNPTSRDVLGKDVMEAVWDDMGRTELPSWMSPAPQNWGTATRGKLTADQWMVICTVHLPITLIRIWGNLDDRRFLLLCNFMDLTSSVQLADQRTINKQMIADSEMLMTRYLTTMKTLFKDSKIQPIHHVALHAGDFLRLFGPTHSVRSFGGERYLEVLGLQNVNNKSGEIEATFMSSICRSSNLQTLLQRDDLPRDSADLQDAYRTVLDEDHRGTRLADETHHPPTKPPTAFDFTPEVHKLLLQALNNKFNTTRYTDVYGTCWSVPHRALGLDKISIRGLIYATDASLPRDSNVIFKRQGGSTLRAGKIKSIFKASYNLSDGSATNSVFVLLHQYDTVADRDLQRNYTQFGFAGGFLCHGARSSKSFVVSTDGIISHFARTGMKPPNQELIHVLPLNKMMDSYTLPIPPQCI